MKKIKIASQDKSNFLRKYCSHSKCDKPSVVIILLGKEERHLCKLHSEQYGRGLIMFEQVNFVKASLL